MDSNKKWRLWLNGLAQAMYSGIAASLSLVVANGVGEVLHIDLSVGPKEFGLVVLGTVIGHVAGYFMKSPLPDIFEVEEADLAAVTKVVDVAEAKITKVVDAANEDIRDIVDK